jgi:hypothetical protein
MKFLLSLAYYHIIYLIIKLIRINPMFLRLKDYSISIGPFTDGLSLTPSHLLHKFPTSLLFAKYYNKTNVLLHTVNFGVFFPPQPSRDFSPLITPLRF